MTVAEFACGTCGHDFCPECVVFPYGLKKPPICITCALARGGVSRRETGRPKLSRKQIKERMKARNLTTMTRSEVRSSGIGKVVEPLPTVEEQQDERWLRGEREPDDFPGGWKQVF
jgi:hypothetical protein